MARKDLLKDLMAQNAEALETKSAAAPARPVSGGAVGAVSKSIADLKARSIVEIDPEHIDNGGLKDRLDGEGLEALALSIDEYGQQVPVLLRPHPREPERYQVVYGRRRVAALKALGRPVKAMVRSLSDRMVILAQGQENAARKDLSFIEKANFARQMRDAGYERKTICDALHVDKTVISRMLSVMDRLPLDLVEAIGAAPSVGRDRWLALSECLEGRDLKDAAKGKNSDQRFDAVFRAASSKPALAKSTAQTARRLAAMDGREALAEMSIAGKKAVLKFTDKAFAEYLAEALPQIHRDWKASREE